MADDVESIRKSIKLYMWVFGSLMVLTVITVAVAYIPFSMTGHIIVALFIASIKAALVALFFMHLNHERKLIYQTLGFTFFFFLGLIFLSLLAKFDVVSL